MNAIWATENTLCLSLALFTVLSSKYWKIENILKEEEAFLYNLSEDFITNWNP